MILKEPASGELNRRVRLRLRRDLPQGDGVGLDSEYEGEFDCWAKIQPVGSAVYSGSVQSGAVVTHRVTLRFRPGITESHEVVAKYRGNEIVYRVRRSSDLSNRRFLVLEVEELGLAAEQGGGIYGY
ncbi:head-tail adaptor protein [Pseudomonas sp. HLMP]|uniref:head-tail adaptor protein n=1 Tax=Pseudomonas sp. HLMP TaxID=3153767 RepID=UPI003966D979